MSSPVLWYATRATGMVAMVLLSLTVVLGLLTAARTTGRTWTRFAVADFHRSVSLLAVLFLAGHVLTSVLDSYVHIGWAAVVIPFASGYKPLWVGLGAVSLDLMAAVVVTSLLRNHLRAGTWRGVHWLSYASWPVAIAHGLGTGTDMRADWAWGLTVVCVAAVAGAAVFRLADGARHRARVLGLPAVQSRTPGVNVKRLVPRPPVPVPIATSAPGGVPRAHRH
ncbi:MAG TPA: ferric reductase-like transmembrane domain-containing protein [Acidimicrobiales bacterium]|nr:ferric reductase-like transmembrane domain-containing protein [Acidimicrobiales bacterium]